MPIYEYHCLKCDQDFEVRQKIDDPVLLTHEGCDGTVERKISASLLQFKGTGFYCNDYQKGRKA